MLVLSRKIGEAIYIGDSITVTVVRIGPNNVRLGIEAPRDVQIVREELTDDAGEDDPRRSNGFGVRHGWDAVDGGPASGRQRESESV